MSELFLESRKVVDGKHWTHYCSKTKTRYALTPEDVAEVFAMFGAEIADTHAIPTLRERKVKPHAAVSKHAKDLIDTNDMVSKFLEDKTSVVPGSRITRNDFYAAYCAYAKEKGWKRITQNKMSYAMRRLGLDDVFWRSCGIPYYRNLKLN